MRACRWSPRALARAVSLLAILTTPSIVIGGGLGPEVPQGKGEQCVEPTDVMRRDHMKFLLHQRDDTVHEGIRTKQHSLNECIACHVQPDANGKFASIDSPEHFCNSCHSWAAVNIDCFQCHAAHPAEGPHASHVGEGAMPAVHRMALGATSPSLDEGSVSIVEGGNQ